MAKWIKNDSGSSKTYMGQVIADQTYYEIQSHEENSWAHDSALLIDIATSDAIVAKDDSGTTNFTDVDLAISYLKDILLQEDADGAQIVRTKAAKKGWTYAAIPIEFTTSKFDSCISELVDGTTRSGFTFKIYDDQDAEITSSANEANAVRAVIEWEPTYDYEVIGGQLQQHTEPTTNMRVWIIGVPDIPVGSGGSKEMVGGINLKYIDPSDKVQTDGRASKYMSYDAVNHTNKLQLTIKHDVGIIHDLMMILEIYRA
jgi:hypothetical protein